MTASPTIAYTARELRTTRTIDAADGQRTIRVRTGRANERREAINTSLGYRR